MIFGLFTLLVAVFISAVSAFYSVTGLTAIFAAAFWPIVIMGSALEIGKITATVWLHKYWHRAGWQFKAYLIPAIIVLMIITSMGTYGYLAKAHMDQSVTVGDSAAQVQILDEKIKTEQDNIASAKRALTQMDAQVDQMLSRTTDDKGTNRAVTIRKQQAGERKNLQTEITTAQKHIAALQNERAPLAAQSRKIEAEVGPIRYIAALIYGDNPDANLLERAVRWVIILLVLVFDPLALVLILAAEQTIAWAREEREKRKGWHQEWVPDTEAWPEWDDEVTEEQIEAIKQEANVSDDIEMTKFFEDGKELAKTIDSNDGKLPKDNPIVITRFTNPESNPDVVADIPVLEGEEMWAQEAIDEHSKLEQAEKDLASAIQLIQEKDAELSALKQPVTEIPLTVTEADNVDKPPTGTNASFGTAFPENPIKGDLFLRVDTLPNKLYKWNGYKWIEVDKNVTDRYVYEEEYIKYLTEQVTGRKIALDDLTKPEQEEVLKHLDYRTKSTL